jgi:hypothetical protein
MDDTVRGANPDEPMQAPSDLFDPITTAYPATAAATPRSRDRATPRRPEGHAEGDVATSAEPANANIASDTTAYVETWPVGDPRSFARALARVLVRRALMETGAIPDDLRCEQPRLAG